MSVTPFCGMTLVYNAIKGPFDKRITTTKEADVGRLVLI